MSFRSFQGSAGYAAETAQLTSLFLPLPLRPPALNYTVTALISLSINLPSLPKR